VSFSSAAGAARLGLATFAVALATAAFVHPAAAQQGANPAPAAAAAAAAADDAKLAKGRDLFNNYGCSGCHSLADAGATGHVGPSFDGDANLSHDFVVDRVTNGSGPMPSFGGQMSPDEIDAIASYVMHAAKK